MQGFALGCIGLSREDFLELTPEEFNAVVWQWQRMEESRNRTAWEQARLSGFLAVLPYSGKRVKMPHDLFAFVWETSRSNKKRSESAKPMNREELNAYFDKLERRYG